MSQESPATGARPIRLGKYEIVSRIASGAMGAVYKARDIATDHIVAVKVLPPDLAANPVLFKRFEREALAAAKLSHENIVGAFELGEFGGTLYIVMEHVEGIDLLRHLQQQQPGRLEVGEAIEIVIQVTRGLEHAHAHGIVHRDVKPSNMLLTQKAGRRVVKLADLGLALDQMGEGDSKITRAGTVLGTVDYMSPEQARGGKVDGRSDVYSLGCSLYHMLTGRTPFFDGPVSEKMYKHVNVMPDDPREFNPSIPDEVILVLGRMLEKSSEDRYQTPAALLRDLERLQRMFPWKPAPAGRDGAAVEAPPARPAPATEPSLERMPKPATAPADEVPPASWLPALLVALALLVLVVVVILILIS
jgi:serine/threonine-protein kinase